jgi:hypothetical protein
MKALFGIFAGLICSTNLAAQACSVDSGFRGDRFKVHYEQRHLVKLFRDLNELPTNVRARLDEHLQARLGRDFVSRLEFDQGQGLDINRLKREFPSLYEENLRLGTYDLVFRFSDSAKGLKYFYTKLALNDDGSVNEEIKLPNIAKDPARAEIISCSDALVIAVAHGFPRGRVSPWFEYSSERDIFIWIVTDSQPIEPPGPFGNGTYRKMELNANTGEVLRVYKETIVI